MQHLIGVNFAQNCFIPFANNCSAVRGFTSVRTLLLIMCVSSSSLKRITAWSSDILNYSLHSYVSDYNDVQGSLTPSIYGLSEKRQIFFVITFGKFCAYHIPHYILPDCTVMGCVKKRCKIVITLPTFGTNMIIQTKRFAYFLITG